MASQMAQHSPPATVPEVTQTMRSRMPEGYIPMLRRRTGADSSILWDIVKNERTNSRWWPEVVKLAEETEAAKGGQDNA
jgi:hypothetical protein